MTVSTDNSSFSFAPLLLLFAPYAGITYFLRTREVFPAGLAAMAAIIGLCLFLYVVRNWQEIVAGFLGALLLMAILAGCAMIPVVGWIADVILILFAFGSVLSSIGSLLPYAVKAALIWAVFLISLLPPVFHPIVCPVVILLLSVGLGSSLGKKPSPTDEFLLIMASWPLLAMAVASLGKLLQSGIGMRSAQFQQNLSAHTRAGVQVDGYTRTITKIVPTVTTTVNPAAAALGSAAGKKAKDDEDEQ
jgi:hypothetical protein